MPKLKPGTAYYAHLCLTCEKTVVIAPMKGLRKQPFIATANCEMCLCDNLIHGYKKAPKRKYRPRTSLAITI